MTIHVVLFRPRRDLGDDERDGLLEAMRVAASEVPTVRGFRIGQHIETPVPYVMGGFPSFPWVALLEFDDVAGLRAYLAHPLHVALGQRFNAAAEGAMIYDYTITHDFRDSGFGTRDSGLGIRDSGLGRREAGGETGGVRTRASF